MFVGKIDIIGVLQWIIENIEKVDWTYDVERKLPEFHFDALLWVAEKGDNGK